MTIGEQLLNLTVEYTEATARAADWGQQYGVDGVRTPEVIAAEYSVALREFLASEPA